MTQVLVEFVATVIVLAALLITCAVLWGARPPRGPQR